MSLGSQDGKTDRRIPAKFCIPREVVERFRLSQDSHDLLSKSRNLEWLGGRDSSGVLFVRLRIVAGSRYPITRHKSLMRGQLIDSLG
jgi:hypothetical protein